MDTTTVARDRIKYIGMFNKTIFTGLIAFVKKGTFI